ARLARQGRRGRPDDPGCRRPEELRRLPEGVPGGDRGVRDRVEEPDDGRDRHPGEVKTMIPISFFFGGAKRTDQTAGRKEGLIGAMTVAWDDQFKRQNIMWKVPRNIRMNDNIVVREDEIAVFYRDGKVVDFAASLNDIEQGTLANSKPHFATLGIEILQISGLNIPLPDAIKDALEKMASAKVLGRTNAAAYQQFALADSMKAAAANPSGGAGTGIGLGAGIGLGYGMASQVPGMIAQQQPQQRPCPKCGTMNPVTTKFCGNCGADT